MKSLIKIGFLSTAFVFGSGCYENKTKNTRQFYAEILITNDFPSSAHRITVDAKEVLPKGEVNQEDRRYTREFSQVDLFKRLAGYEGLNQISVYTLPRFVVAPGTYKMTVLAYDSSGKLIRSSESCPIDAQPGNTVNAGPGKTNASLAICESSEQRKEDSDNKAPQGEKKEPANEGETGRDTPQGDSPKGETPGAGETTTSKPSGSGDGSEGHQGQNSNPSDSKPDNAEVVITPQKVNQ